MGQPPNSAAVPQHAITGWVARHWRLSLLLAGLCAAAALPPVHALPLLWPAFTILAWLLHRATARWRAFWIGFLFGFGMHVGGLYWLAWPLTLDLARFGWMIPFAVFGISAGLAVVTGLVTLTTYSIARKTRIGWIGQIILLASIWAVGEWLRAHLFSGFPWNLLASVWISFPPILQIVAMIGPYGLALVTVLIAALPAAVLAHSPDQQPRRRHRTGVLITAPVLLLILAVCGWLRLPGTPADRGPMVPGIQLRLVQGAVAQQLKWDPASRQRHLDLYLTLSQQKAEKAPTHILWPETAVDYRFMTAHRSAFLNGRNLTRLLAVIPDAGALLIGAIRDDGQRYYNSFHAVTKGGKLAATYDKHHLVPFGEYVPARNILKRLGVERLAHGRADYSPGPGPRTLKVSGLPAFGVHICYEAIFPHEAVGTTRPRWIVNVTNDAWFGHTSGPYQHLAAAQLRAAEQGLPVARVANSGISAVIDPYGRIVAQLGLDRRGVLDAPLPEALPATFYARIGDWTLAIILLLVVLALGLMHAITGARTPNPPK